MWPEGIKKRICKYLLEHYLGNFLQEKLHLDQLNVDLYNGRGFVENVMLDIYTINEILQSVHAPIEVLKGSVGSISVSIPWTKIMSDSCIVEVKGLHMVVQPMYRADVDLTDITGSFYSSLKSMTTSMQLAQDGLQDQDKKESTGQYEGLNLWTNSIESVLRRIKVKFCDITVCFEHSGQSSSTGIGLELSVSQFEYFDEDSDKSTATAARFQDKDVPIVEDIAFTCKQFRVSGVHLSLYEFHNSNNGVFSSMKANSQNFMLNPVLIAECFGEQQIKLRVKQNEQVSGPKVDAEFYLGSCCSFLTPKQVHLLLEFIEGFTNPLNAEPNYTADSFPSSVSPSVAVNKPMTYDDYRHIEGQLADPGFQTSHYCECNDESEHDISFGSVSKSKSVQFYSMSKFPTATSNPSYTMPIRSDVKHMEEMESLSPQSLASTQLTYDNLNGKLDHQKHNSNCVDDMPEEAFRFQMNIRALSLTILHIDPMDLTQFGEENRQIVINKDTGAVGKSSPVDGNVVGSKYETFVSKYFEKVKKVFENYYLGDLFKKHSYFTNADFKYDHLRILAGPLHIECERQTVSPSSLSSSNTKIVASVGDLDFVECLLNDNDLQSTSGSKFTYVDLLVFPTATENKAQAMRTSIYKEHVVQLEVELCESCDLTQTSINLHLASCKSEVDISIVDRLNALFYSANLKSQAQPVAGHSSEYPSINNQMLNKQAYFQKALDDEHEEKLRKLDFKLSSPQMHIEFRFPIPDLRPEIQKRPWFKRSLRGEVLHITVKDLMGSTNISFADDLDKISDERKVVKVRFRDLSASYSDEVGKPAKLFLQTHQRENDEAESSRSDYDWPLIEIQLQEDKCASQLCCNQENYIQNDERFSENSPHRFSLPKDHDTYFSNDFPMFASFYEQPTNRIPSPFSQRKVRYDNEEIILPGDEKEIQDFIDHASSTAKINLVLSFPVVQVNVPSKCFVESIYNRINNDLLLWEPVAPQPTQLPTDESNVAHIPTKLDFASQFFSAKHGFQDLNRNTAKMSDMHVSFATDDDIDASIISKASNDDKKSTNQSFLSLSLAISHGSMSMCSMVPFNEETSQTGLIYIVLENGSLFTVSRYHSNPNVDYACIQVDSCSISHKIGLLSIPVMQETRGLPIVPPSLKSIIHPNEEGVDQAFGHHRTPNAQNLTNQKRVTVVIKVELEEKRSMKQCFIASQMQGLTMRHQFLPPGHHWLEQLLDIFNIEDTPVLGYEPPSFLTEVHFHLKECAVDYKPLHLSSHAVATLHSFSLSSNVAANSPLSVLQILMDNVFIYISDNSTSSCIDLQRNFVNVLDISLLELCLRLSSQLQPNHSGDLKHPLIELIVSNNQFEMRTCADSFATFAALLRYIAADGDIVLSEDYQQQSRTNSSSATSQVLELTSEQKELNAELEKQHQLDMERELSSLMEDAMKDVHIDDEVRKATIPAVSVNGKAKDYADGIHQTQDTTFSLPDDDDDFCIIADPNLQSYKDFEPEVEYLVKEQGTKVVVVENHFAPVFGKADVLRAPDHFPIPLMRYVIRDLSCAWYMYGGNDFTIKKNTSKHDLLRRNLSKEKDLYESPKHKHSDYLKSPHHSNRKVGGFNRNYKVMMEFHLMKVRFQHDAYKPEDEYVSRTVFTITDFEIRDRLDSSQINKFLYHYHNEASPKQSHANMLLVKALLIKPAPDKAPECRLKVSLQPLRLNVDQDALIFMMDFFTTLSNSLTDDATLASDNRSSTLDTTSMADPQLQFEPVLKMSDSKLSSASLNTVKNEESSQIPLQPLFFREFVFSPDVPIVLDYHGKHIDIEQGKLAGLLMGLGQLNCSQFKLRRIVHRHGLLGVDRVVNFALNTWAADIRNNQLSSLLGGVGPMHSVVQFFQGVRDLVWLPVEQYRRDGRIVKGVQRGTSSFGTSTSMAVLEITNRLVSLVQVTAESTRDFVAPAEYQRSKERQLNSWHGLERHARLKRQPTDLREGFINAVNVMQHGVTNTASSLADVAVREHERRGVAGAAGGVIRYMPLVIVTPMALGAEAASNVLSGMRNQILPDAKREDEDKWRSSAHNS